MRGIAAFAGALALVCTLGAKADTLETFNVNVPGTQGGYSVSGTLTFDATTGMFTGSDLSTSFGAITGAPTEFGDNQSSSYAGFGDFGVSQYVVFNIPGLSLVGYAGGPLCDVGAECGNASSYLVDSGEDFYELDSGSNLSLVAATTPEPSSLLLLATGLGGMVTVARRRFTT